MASPAPTALGGGVATNTASPTATFTTALTNFVMVVGVYNEHASALNAATVSSISVTNAGSPTFTLRKRQNVTQTGGMELWYSSPIASVSGSATLTVNMSGAYDDMGFSVLGITGLFNNSAPFDTNAGLPQGASAPSASAWTPSFTVNTDEANDLLLMMAGAPTSSPSGGGTPPTGWVLTDHHGTGAGSWACQFDVYTRQVTAKQVAQVITSNTTYSTTFSGSITSQEAIFDALTGDASGGGGSQARAMILA